MPESTMTAQAALTRVRRARNFFLRSQVAVLDLAELSETEAARLDFPEQRGKRLVELVGRPDLPVDLGVKIYNAADALIARSLERRDLERKSAAEKDETGDEPDAEVVAGEAAAPDAGDTDEAPTGQKPDPVEVARAAESDAFTALDDLVAEAELPGELMVNILSETVKLAAEKPRRALMLESLLISSVSQFEIFASKLISTSLRMDTSPLTRSDRTFSFSEVVEYATTEQFIASAADDYVDTLMYKGMDDWMKFLARATRSDTEWVSDLMAEVVMRRNVHVHAGGRASSQYIKALGKKAAAVKVGDDLPVTAEYLRDALDRMSRIAIVLTQAAVAAVCSGADEAEKGDLNQDLGVVESSFDLLTAGRHSAVAPLYEQLCDFTDANGTKERLRANSLHAKKMLHGLDATLSEIQAWDVSSASDDLILAKHCLLEQIPEARSLYDKLNAAGTVTLTELATWPILTPLRDALEADTGPDAPASEPK